MIRKNRTRTFAVVAVALLATLSLIGSTTSADTTPPQNQPPAVLEGVAAPSTFLNYQGRLLDRDGNPVPDRDYTIAFAIFDDPAAGTKLWTESKSVAVSNGLFSVPLGDVNPLDAIFTGQALWLAIQVSGEEVSPRIPIAYVPYAFRAANATNATNATSASIAANASNADRLGGSLPSAYAAAVHSHDATNIVSGILHTDRYHAVDDLTAEFYLGNAAGDIALNNGVLQATLNADLLDGIHSTGFASVAHNHDPAYVNATGDTMNGTLNVSVPAGGSHGISSFTASTATGAAGVEAKNTGAGYGLNAFSASNNAIIASSNSASSGTAAIYSLNTGTGPGLWSNSNSGRGVEAHGSTIGVYAYATSATGANYGLYARTASTAAGYAGYFSGNVFVAGTLGKSAGGFKIDHPQDPQNKYLSHSFVESPDMKNIYDGNVVLDADGKAWVELPVWFEALNRDFRYQLTAVGGPGPSLYIAQKIQNNRFQIAGGTPGLEVSWQVTGIRQDAYANAHRIPVEEDKPADQQGTYLNPDAFGQPESLGADKALALPIAAAVEPAAVQPEKP